MDIPVYKVIDNTANRKKQHIPSTQFNLIAEVLGISSFDFLFGRSRVRSQMGVPSVRGFVEAFSLGP